MRALFRLAGFAIVLGLVVAAAGAAWLYRAAEVDRSLPRAEAVVIVPRGASTSDIAKLLVSQGVLAQTLPFRAVVRLRGLETKIEAGEYRFAPHRTVEELLAQLQAGSQIAVWVTIPEGFTSREIAQTLAEHGLGDAQALADYFATTSIDLDGTPTASLEGMLFPDTYLMPVGSSPETLANVMIDEFRRKLPRDAAARAKRLGLTVPQVVTVASLIEREAKADDERRLMAGVYYNRLRIGMPLEVDATIEYTFDHHKDVITLADLARDSPYNTYKHTGLPPTPIASPGEPSLAAAFDPQPSQFLFYVYKGNGHHAFSRTLAEHNANVARYLH